MTTPDYVSGTRRAATPPSSPHRGAAGVLIFAGLLMIMSGTFQAIQGLVALANDSFYVVGEEYIFRLDLTTWGWIHLLIGVVVAAAGFGLLRGATWARVVAIILASISIVLNFVWLPYYPVWGLVIIAFDLFVIWAATVHGRSVAAE